MQMSRIKYLLIGVLLAACGTAGDGQAPESTTTSTIPENTTTGEGITKMSLPDQFPQGLFDAILADASSRTGVLESAIELLSVESETFSDTSLGCPEPGKMYAQVMTPGFVVLLEADGAQLDYRVDERSELFVVCE